jgi:hypothetical protein
VSSLTSNMSKFKRLLRVCPKEKPLKLSIYALTKTSWITSDLETELKSLVSTRLWE